MPSAAPNPVNVPEVIAGNGPLNTDCAKDKLAPPTEAVPDVVDSDPTQLRPITGVTVYFHTPAGTDDSTQLVAATVPVHADSIVCNTPPAVYRFTTYPSTACPFDNVTAAQDTVTPPPPAGAA